MVFQIIIIIITFSLLIILHELGHFLMAKKFGVKVEEFGLGLPPRFFGKKIGETIFSLNLIPFGGFVRMYGEEENIKDSRSFTGKPIWQRILIVIAGCVVFWIIAAILLSIVFGIGAPVAISDDEKNLDDVRVQIMAVAVESPAEKAGLEMEDTIRGLSIEDEKLAVTKVREIQEFINLHKGEEVTLIIERGREVFETTLIPRIEPPEGEGAMGVALARTAIKVYSWYQAPIQGVLTTGYMTKTIVQGWANILGNKIRREEMPPGTKIMGPVGIFGFMGERLQMGIVHFLHFIVIICIFLALFNLMPIPALDGGKLVFLGIEAIRKKPIPQKIEQNITSFFFFLLIGLMIFITIRFDIPRLF